jgi:hypothetical protein
MTTMENSPSEKHLLDQLRMSMRVASDRLAEGERRERAYVALIEHMERRLVHAKQARTSARVWMWTAWACVGWLLVLLIVFIK